ncbi:MAG: 50S ribosomal protein L34e [Nanoarchaeota archaeon]
MTFGKNKSRKRGRTYVKTATRTKIVYSKNKKRLFFCTNCNAILQAMMPYRGISLSQKRPSRPFGGSLCTACVRDTFKQRARI